MARSLSYFALLGFGALAGAMVGVEIDGDSLNYALAAVALLIGLGPFILE